MIDLQIVKNLCIPGVNPTWTWCMILFMCFCFVLFLLAFSSGFLHWCSSVMLACNLVFCVAFLLHFGSWWWWAHRISWECSFLHIFLEQFDQHRYYHISTIWEQSPVKSWAFLCWRLLITVSSACDWSVQSWWLVSDLFIFIHILYFFLVQS